VSSTALPRPVLADLAPGERVRDAALVLAVVALTALSARIVIPLPFTPVPISGQTFAVLLGAAAVGPLRGSVAQLLYLLLGAVGLPFFAQGTSGVEVLTGTNGGYLVGFVIATLVVGVCARRGWDRSPLGVIAAFALGNLAIYALGVSWLSYRAGLTVPAAVGAGLVPFVVGDVVKALAAAALLPLAWRLTRRD